MVTISLFLFAFLFILFFPIKCTFKMHFNLVERLAFYSGKVLFLTVICGKLEIKNGKLHILNLTNKIPKSSSGGMVFIKEFIKQIEAIECNVFYVGGQQNNAYHTALMSGIVLSSIDAVFAYIRNFKSYFKSSFKADETSKSNQFMMTINSNIVFTLLDILLAVLSSILIKIKGKVNGKR